jgi:hypothetical protein
MKLNQVKIFLWATLCFSLWLNAQNNPAEKFTSELKYVYSISNGEALNLYKTEKCR